MLKLLKHKTFLMVGLGLILTLMLGSTWFNSDLGNWLTQKTDQLEPVSSFSWQNNQFSPVLALANVPAQQRAIQLQTYATGKKSLDRIRASYLLASDAITQNKGEQALRHLKNLEKDYPVLAPYILFKRGQAYQLNNQKRQALETWEQLIQNYPKSPAVSQALASMGEFDAKYWQKAIAEHQDHPDTQQIARQLLKNKPNQLPLLLLLTKYSANDRDSSQIKDRLIQQYASQLKPEDWQTIADGYWQKWEYAKAANAYIKAPSTAKNLYRYARSLHLSGEKSKAKTAYLQLMKSFANDEETGLGLRRLASISKGKEDLIYLDRVINKFPKEAPEAILLKAKILTKLKNAQGVKETYKLLLDKYPTSDAAAQYRWQLAQREADAGNLVKAWQWAQAIATNNPDSPLAAKASFWIGKWALSLNRLDDARISLRYVLNRYPQSYYAWRAAFLLGWNVGDFNSVRQIDPQIQLPASRSTPPAGSDTFKELYLIGEEKEAWNVFQTEIAAKTEEELSISEQFTDGLLQIAKGKTLLGIDRIWSLQARKAPQDQAEWESLRKTSEYWHALFPFPYGETILKWSRQRQLNPLLVTGLIRQESRFEPEIRSSVGATGLMQVMPETGKYVAEQIKLKEYSLTNPNDNINLGTAYLDYTHRKYEDNSLLAIASYNAGPGNVSKWVEKSGLVDPDEFVEKIPFAETQGYVEAVFGNYWNYMRIYNPEISQMYRLQGK